MAFNLILQFIIVSSAKTFVCSTQILIRLAGCECLWVGPGIKIIACQGQNSIKRPWHRQPPPI